MEDETEAVLEPAGVAQWLRTTERWVHDAIEEEGLPVFGRRSDGVPLMLVSEVRAWLRRPHPSDDAT